MNNADGVRSNIARSVSNVRMRTSTKGGAHQKRGVCSRVKNCTDGERGKGKKISLSLIFHVLLQSFEEQTSPRSERGSLAIMEAAMREEIRELHEQRAAAMMTEIVELQKDRDLALAKVRRLEKKVKGKIIRCIAKFLAISSPVVYFSLRHGD